MLSQWGDREEAIDDKTLLKLHAARRSKMLAWSAMA
jgi:hypothetical protein